MATAGDVTDAGTTLSLADVARLARVARPVVTMWRKRPLPDAPFPAPDARSRLDARTGQRRMTPDAFGPGHPRADYQHTLTGGHDTGWWDDNGHPAPWPDDFLDPDTHWRPDTNPTTQPTPAEQPF
ncbi:MAG: hypothetical protein M0Z51_13125 [Propionibacterium sp.]|nr:hypothetical protein [Propionibacterium sp.]